MASRRDKVLADLLAIYTKYDASEIEDALNALRTGEAFRGIDQLGAEVTKAAPEDIAHLRAHLLKHGKRKRSRTPRDRLRDLISELLSSENSNDREVGQMLQAAQNREVLFPSPLLQRFIAATGLPIPRGKDRTDALILLGQHLPKLPSEAIALALEMAKEARTEESSLQRWTDIIVQKNRT
jgi:hypothetical protein